MATAVLTSQPNPGFKYTEKIQSYVDNIKQYASSGQTNGKSGEAIATSGPQGKVVPLTIVDDPADWTAESLKGKEDEYTWTLDNKDVQDVIAATEKITARLPATEGSVKALTKEDYDWPEFSAKLLEAMKNVSLGRGFHLIRGFPVEHFRGNRFGLVVAFWGLALELGTPQISQTDHDRKHNTFGSLLNHVAVGRFTTVKGADVYPQTKKNQTETTDFHNTNGFDAKTGKFDRLINERRLGFHNDQGATDLTALLSINKAKSGGESKLVSAVAVHNELLRRGRKDLVEALSTTGDWKIPYKIDQQSYARDKDGKPLGYEDDPPFVHHNGYLSFHYTTSNFLEIELTALQKEAVWTFAAIAEDPKFHFAKIFEPGEIEIFSNQFILHARGDIENGLKPQENRHLLRWWVARPKEQNPRGVIPGFAPRSNVNPEGGFRVPSKDKIALLVPFYPYSAHDGEGQSEW